MTTSLTDTVVVLVQILENAGFEYALGGAIALGFWATPRATVDIDVGVNVVRVPFGQADVWIVSAEDIALLKMLFGRTKDHADLERLFALQGDKLDYAYLKTQSEALVSADDPRLAHFRGLCEAAQRS